MKDGGPVGNQGYQVTQNPVVLRKLSITAIMCSERKAEQYFVRAAVQMAVSYSDEGAHPNPSPGLATDKNCLHELRLERYFLS